MDMGISMSAYDVIGGYKGALYNSICIDFFQVIAYGLCPIFAYICFDKSKITVHDAISLYYHYAILERPFFLCQLV